MKKGGPMEGIRGRKHTIAGRGGSMQKVAIVRLGKSKGTGTTSKQQKAKGKKLSREATGEREGRFQKVDADSGRPGGTLPDCPERIQTRWQRGDQRMEGSSEGFNRRYCHRR